MDSGVAMVNGVSLKIFTSEFVKHDGKLLYEWLLEYAQKQGMPGGSAFRALAGFGRHGMREEHFFELASNVPVEVLFIGSDDQITQFLIALGREKVNCFYVKAPVEYGLLDSNN